MIVGVDFDVSVTREAGYWVGVVHGLAGGAAETRELADLEPELVDLVAGLTDLDPPDIALHFEGGGTA